MYQWGVRSRWVQDKVLEMLRRDRLPTEKELAAKFRHELGKGQPEIAAAAVLRALNKPPPRKLAPG